MNDGETCDLCGRPIAPGKTEQWVGPKGEVIEIVSSLLPSAVVTIGESELDICGECYPRAVEERFSGKDLAAIHYEFGLGFRNRQDKIGAADCFRRAIALHRTADYLAALAGTASSREESDQWNHEALILDPACSMAKWNLARPIQDGEYDA